MRSSRSSPGRDLAEAQRVLAAAAGVLEEGEQVLLRAHGPAADLVELLPVGLLVRVDQDLLARPEPTGWRA